MATTVVLVVTVEVVTVSSGRVVVGAEVGDTVTVLLHPATTLARATSVQSRKSLVTRPHSCRRAVYRPETLGNSTVWS